jgi:hypothetical protein
MKKSAIVRDHLQTPLNWLSNPRRPLGVQAPPPWTQLKLKNGAYSMRR